MIRNNEHLLERASPGFKKVFTALKRGDLPKVRQVTLLPKGTHGLWDTTTGAVTKVVTVSKSTLYDWAGGHELSKELAVIGDHPHGIVLKDLTDNSLYLISGRGYPCIPGWVVDTKNKDFFEKLSPPQWNYTRPFTLAEVKEHFQSNLLSCAIISQHVLGMYHTRATLKAWEHHEEMGQRIREHLALFPQAQLKAWTPMKTQIIWTGDRQSFLGWVITLRIEGKEIPGVIVIDENMMTRAVMWCFLEAHPAQTQGEVQYRGRGLKLPLIALAQGPLAEHYVSAGRLRSFKHVAAPEEHFQHYEAVLKAAQADTLKVDNFGQVTL